MKTAAVVIWYNPEPLFVENLKSYAEHVDHVVVIDNSNTDNAALLADVAGVHYQALHQNLGIAAALNRGFETARQLGAEWVLSMDQDSSFESENVSLLLANIETASSDIAVIGYSETGSTSKTGLRDVNKVITSGCLNRMSAFSRINGFNEDLFIDQVDFEYCFRLKEAGFRIMQDRAVQMRHNRGDPEPKEFRGRSYTTTNYNPTRRYYQVRNRLYMRRKFPQYGMQHIKNIVYATRNVILFEDNKLSKLAAMAQGAWHFVIGRYGPR
ncbi:glycosyltransferase family 2 protein [Roseobacter sp. MH60115]|uniref:glycosyltransferase family 2 protein n=1 Tax=Roseobacter sp. MH60115 TaxID=2785324 RepID=UPI0018A27095|nr:glycosyltransferase family 2 protein [Roseobacter sp. MH60115]